MTQNDLVHFSSQRIEMLRPNVYKQRPGYKPHGLWVSVGAAWRTWCEGESWNLNGVKYAYTIQLTHPANILRLRGVADIDRFTDTYRTGTAVGGLFIGYIDWLTVAATYQGIIIAPYCWERRLEPGFSWYYGWDCASGCIWDLSIVKLLPVSPAATPRHEEERR
jgi:hypothetical protein